MAIRLRASTRLDTEGRRGESIEGDDRAARLRELAEDAAGDRYRLTALGEAFVAGRRRPRFHGFGPCAVARLDVEGR